MIEMVSVKFVKLVARLWKATTVVHAAMVGSISVVVRHARRVMV